MKNTDDTRLGVFSTCDSARITVTARLGRHIGMACCNGAASETHARCSCGRNPSSSVVVSSKQQPGNLQHRAASHLHGWSNSGCCGVDGTADHAIRITTVHHHDTKHIGVIQHLRRQAAPRVSGSALAFEAWRQAAGQWLHAARAVACGSTLAWSRADSLLRPFALRASISAATYLSKREELCRSRW
jgi:hypothetical protein